MWAERGIAAPGVGRSQGSRGEAALLLDSRPCSPSQAWRSPEPLPGGAGSGRGRLLLGSDSRCQSRQ